MSGAAIDPFAADLLSVSAVARAVSRDGHKPVSPSTVVRWIVEGARDRSGNRVKLAAVKVGARWATTKAAVDEFVAAISGPAADTFAGRVAKAAQTATDPAVRAWLNRLAADPEAGEVIVPRSPAQRSRANEEAAKWLDAKGVGVDRRGQR